ncbi:uncharacterized protein [Montipora capricornis]|uniref:uncharacterized protein n=1 Tax=Montipora capricornis TaxID=246305 RepID=UPI0035F1D54B
MVFNVKKCKVMRLTKKRQPLVSNYSLDNSPLEEVKEFKDLGVTTTDNFNWNSHIDIIVSKANRMLGLIKRTCRGLDDTKTLRTLYCALVRSNVEYCSVVWSPYTKKNIEKVEKVQRRATKFILKTEDNYETRLKKLNLMSLKNRRILADVTFLYKALNGISNVNIDSYIDFYSDADRYSFRKYDDLTLKNKYARTNPLKYSFFHRIVDSWNLLPYDIRKAVSVNIFKRGVKKFLLDNTLN